VRGPPSQLCLHAFWLAQHQRHLRDVLAAHETRHQEILAEEALTLHEPPEPQEPREAQDPGAS
jgi:hypothetical protein